VLRQHQVGAQQPATGLQQALENHGGEGEGRVRDDAVRPRGQPQVRRIGLYDDDGAPEERPQVGGSAGVHLDGDDTGTCLEQSRREGTAAGPDVEDQVAGPDGGVSDEASRPPCVELVPSPPPWRSHGRAPS
jgi:hypothetical protein